MAVSDVYRVKMLGEGREGEWQMNFHYRELTVPTLAPGPDALSEGINTHLTGVIRAALAASNQVSRWIVDKLSGEPQPAASFSSPEANRVGTNSAIALPASKPIRFTLLQQVFSQASNGGVSMSGIPQDQVTGNVALNAYMEGVIAAIAGDLLSDVEEESAGDGLWGLIVLSRKYLILNPGDFEGASADVTAISVDPRVGMMRSRRFGGRKRRKKIIPPPEEE